MRRTLRWDSTATVFLCLLKPCEDLITPQAGSTTDKRWLDVCAEFEDVFAEPGTPVERDIVHRIPLVDEG